MGINIMTVYNGPDVASKQLLNALENYIKEFKEIDLQLTSADGDRETAVQAFIDSSDDETVVKLRAQLEKLEAKLQEYAEQNAVVITLSDDERVKLQEQRESLKQTIRKGRSVVEDVAKTMNTDFPNVVLALNELGDPTKSGRGRKPGSGGGSSLPRISATLTIKEVSEEGDQALVDKVYDSFSQVALKFNCDVKDLQLAFAEAAGVTHENIKSVDHPVEFAFQPNANGAVYVFRTTPKERKTRSDSKTDSKTATETEAPETVAEAVNEAVNTGA
jgi:hypothetical protein